MPMNAVYRGPADLPQVIPVFPLPGALLLPRGQMPLNIFEPRYLAMIDDAMADRHRLIGMIQPDTAHPGPEDKPNLYKIGCAGRITQLAETGDGRYLIELTGVARFRLVDEPSVLTPYRQCSVDFRAFADDFVARKGEGAVDREELLKALAELPQGEQAQRRLGGHREGAERGAGQRACHDVAVRLRRQAGDARSAGPQDPRRNPGRAHRNGACEEQQRGRNEAAIAALPC